MKTINITDLIPDNRNWNYGYLPKDIARKHDLKIGDVFAIDCGDEKFKIVSESTYREDVHQTFDGFACIMTIGS